MNPVPRYRVKYLTKRALAGTCPASAYAPARLLLAEHNIDLQQFGDDLLASLTA
ncbi:MAG TPA: hypothetical protein VGL39_22770 [Jatrophihabitantaceae bacterium]|jgi:hypothetical protein